ncbi:MAG: DUF4924 family protein [Muribaculaceae bacterium]|nr:DUF4924 family protein [Muribaculaceae bacterium]
MIIASQKRKENISEYLLYMWQIEDIIRANSLDIEKIKKQVIDPYPISDQQKKEMTEWYESLIEMMRREGVVEKGHLQINKNVLASMVELHQSLLQDPKHSDYNAEFYRTLPYIVELRAKAGEEKPGEIEACFNALYGMLLLRLKGQNISAETQNAIKQISKFLALLTKFYHLDEKGELNSSD